jgi:hypothetical protein
VKRGEWGVILVGVAIGVTLAIAIGIWADVFANSKYSNGGSNLLGIIGTVPLITALAVAAWARWHRTCAIPWCLRFGEHPVDGTLRKVCTHHHTLVDHERVYDLHHQKHVDSGRLEFGQSHNRGKGGT